MTTEQKKLTLIRSRGPARLQSMSQQDTELSAKESCPAGAVQDTHCSGCCCCGAVGILETERWTVYHRWRLAGCSAEGRVGWLKVVGPSFLPAERSQSVIFPRSYCYGSVLAPVIAEYRWLRGAHQAAANQRRELEQCCRVSHRQIQRKERVPNAYVIFCTYETYVRNAYGKITYAFARTLSATAQQHGATERDVASLMCTYIVYILSCMLVLGASATQRPTTRMLSATVWPPAEQSWFSLRGNAPVSQCLDRTRSGEKCRGSAPAGAV